MKNKQTIIVAFTLLMVVNLLAVQLAFAQQRKFNILFIAVDDLRPELGCYGAPQVKSPCIDELAGHGLVFNRAYCNVPVCGASRASLFTGILPTKTRFVNYLSRADFDVPGAVTLPQVFKEAGYTCISNGKIFHHNDDAMEQSWSFPAWRPGFGFETSLDSATARELSPGGRKRIYEGPDVDDHDYADGLVAQKTIEDLKQLQQTGKPFFLACGFVRPHLPFYAPKNYWELYNRDSIVIAQNRYRPENAPSSLRGSGEFKTYHLGGYDPKTDEFHRMMRHGYMACVSYADKLVGDVLDKLEETGLAQNTIVVLWGDHGWHLGEHDFWGKHNTLHNALQVPLIIKVPGKTYGEQTQALIESIDIFPTLCELAGLEIPGSVMGKSFVSLFENPKQQFREAVYSRFKVADAIVTVNYTYSLYENGEEMLYNRETDPEENKNVIDDPSHADTILKMKSYLTSSENLAKEYGVSNQ